MVLHGYLPPTNLFPVPELNFWRELQSMLAVYFHLPLDLLCPQSVEMSVMRSRSQSTGEIPHQCVLPVAKLVFGARLAGLISDAYMSLGVRKAVQSGVK